MVLAIEPIIPHILTGKHAKGFLPDLFNRFSEIVFRSLKTLK